MTLSELPPFSGDEVNVIIETPKGSHNKLSYNEEFRVFELRSVLAAGAVFPFDFGFIPSTKGEDGDPLDVLVLMDEATYPGTLVRGKLIGAIEAEQTEKGKTERNDRLIAVASATRHHAHIDSLADVSASLRHEIEHFFNSYNQVKRKEFKILGQTAPGRARELVKQGQERAGSKR